MALQSTGIKSRKVDVRGVTYHLETAGAGEPLLLLHGFTGASTNWYPLIPMLTSCFECILVDILGHGKSSIPTEEKRYQMNEVAQDIIEVLDALSLKTVNLLGYSMGGRLALYLAVNYPARFSRLVLESASPGLATSEEQQERIKRDNQLAARILHDGIVEFVNFWEQIPLFKTQQSLEESLRLQLREQRLKTIRWDW